MINNNEISVNPAALPQQSQGARIGFSNSSTWTCPSGITEITVQLWSAAGGGGGGGAGSADDNKGCEVGFYGCRVGGQGGKGGDGGYIRQIVNVTPGATYNITIGLGGAGGVAPCATSGSGFSGSDGGSSSFGGVLTAPGGSGGQGGIAISPGCWPNPCPSCAVGFQGANGSVINYNSNEVSVGIQSQSSPISYIPSGYVTTMVTVTPQSLGGSGGNGGHKAGTTCGGCPANGVVGQNGFCVISY